MKLPMHTPVALLLLASAACVTSPSGLSPAASQDRRGGISLIGPACAGVDSCLMGQVVAAESAAPLARATIFLERESAPNAQTEEELARDVRYMLVTDDQGVFTVIDAPAGLYRLAVYKEERQYEVRGLSLGGPGTAFVPVRLPKV